MTFAGFDRDAMGFLHELAIEMNRDWFEANKARYQRVWVEPMTALLEHVAGKLAKAYAPVKLGEPKLFRIYRDTRFSKDKSPYKTHVAGQLPLSSRKPIDGGCSALYLHLGVDEEYIGVGTYFFDPAQLPRWRKLVAADRTGRPLAQLVGKLRRAGYRVGGHEDYKKVPKPYAEDHPRGELLRMRGLTGGLPEIPRGMLHRAALADWLVDQLRPTVPLVRWLHQHMR
ncbi:MAG: DUF2461 domain-containing protein [Acidobacteriota bacterium]